jgi:hypothetical protein
MLVPVFLEFFCFDYCTGIYQPEAGGCITKEIHGILNVYGLSFVKSIFSWLVPCDENEPGWIRTPAHPTCGLGNEHFSYTNKLR